MRFLFCSHASQQLLTQHRQNLLVEQTVDVARSSIRQQAGGGQSVIQALVNVRGQTVVTVQALTDLCEFHLHNGTHGRFSQRAINHGLKAGQQRRLEVVTQYRAQQLVQVAFGGLRLFVQQLHQVVAPEVGGHQNNRVAEVDFAPFAIAHKAAVEDLIEQVHDVAVRFFHFIEQHHAVRTLAYRFGEDAALAVANVTWG